MRFGRNARKRSTIGLLAAAGIALTLALLAPANAQFWNDWGGGRQRQQNNGGFFGGWGGFDRGWDRDNRPRQEVPVDFSRAPAATPRKDATMSIVVLGDSMADWLAYGLEDAYSEKPDVGIVRRHRTDAGLIRYDPRREIEWPQVIRETIAADKPKFIVMMIGNNDRVVIREKQPPAPARPGTPAAPKGSAQPAAQQQAAPAKPAEPQDAELQQEPAEQQPAPTTEQARQALYGPWEFHTEKWELAYIKRIDAAIAAMKSAGVPVIWVGLPSRNGAKATTDVAYLNELYKSRAEKAGIIFVDIWDGFVDEQGRYNAQGPDYEGQTRRLRTGDGVHFTKFGARKLAHYVEREIERSIASRAVPVALPPIDQGPQPGTPSAAKPGVPVQRPSAGPVLPLTTTATAPEELLGGGRAPAPARPADPVATRVLTKGEAVNAPTGRADDFAWPRGNAADEPATILPATALTPAGLTKPGELPSPTTDADAKKAAEDAAPKRAAAPQPQRQTTREESRGGGWFGGWGGWGSNNGNRGGWGGFGGWGR
jgi:lysophospholipase L1-like esterase